MKLRLKIHTTSAASFIVLSGIQSALQFELFAFTFGVVYGRVGGILLFVGFGEYFG